MEVVCFHKINEENGYLSNWYKSEFYKDNIKFTSVEQYMMYRKAVVFNDKKIAAEILESDDVAVIKALGRKVSGYNETYWNGIRQIEVYRGLLEKFRQNEDLKKRLKETGDAVLAECAVSDRVWGIGISMYDKDRFDIEKWKGRNLLGYALMKVREEL